MAGRMTEMKGTAKETAGKALGNEQMRAEGQADKMRGKTERKMAGMKDQAKGSLKSAAGKALGNEQMRVEGAADKMKGRVERAG
jgi:uncharacterized protein YjbJ (UPF0337 family)